MIQNVSYSILAGLHPCKKDDSNRVSNYRQCFEELNNESFDFSDGFRCSDVHKFEILINLTFDSIEMKFYQDKTEWKHNLMPIGSSKNDSDKNNDWLTYENHYALIKKLKVFIEDHHEKLICRRCLSYLQMKIC